MDSNYDDVALQPGDDANLKINLENSYKRI